MKVNSTINWAGKDYPVQYEDLEDFDGIREFNQIYGVCFVENKIVICFNESLGFWVLPGGTPEAEENVEQALRREIMEEAGLKLLYYRPIGVQRVVGDGKIRTQLRAVCKCEIVTKHNDPSGDISEVKLIDIKAIEKYIDWGEIGSHIFKRAKVLHDNL